MRLPALPPTVCAARIGAGCKPTSSAVVIWKLPNRILLDILEPVIKEPSIPTSAASAVREGLDPEAALRAVTITPARVLGIDERVGSLEPGKDADIVVYGGSPFNLMSRIELVMMDGEIVTD